MQLLKFYADWCNPCKALTSYMDTLELPVDVVPVNLDENMELATIYSIRTIPSLVLIGPDGTTVEIAVGTDKSKDLLKRLGAEE